MMNRKARRAFVKQARKKGATKEQAEIYVAYKTLQEVAEKNGDAPTRLFEDGDEVQINVDSYKTQKNYENYTQDCKDFIENSKGKTYKCRLKMAGNIYKLYEEIDGEEVEYDYFFWGGDLIKATECEPKSEE